MRFTIDTKHLIKSMWVKKLRRKTLAQDVFDRSWRLDGVKTLVKNISARFLTLLIFAVGWALCGHPNTQVSDATAVTFSVKYFNPWKLSSVRKHLQKVVCFILFIYLRAFNNNVISNGKSFCCNNIFTDIRFSSLLA